MGTADVGPSSQSSPSQRRSSRMLCSDSRVERSASVSSMRSTNVPSLPCASSQLKRAVRAFPTCSWPVGLGANRTRILQSAVINRQTLVRSATACAAMASPRPTASTPSFVFPFTLTRLTSMPMRAGEARLDLAAVRPDLRPLENDDHVDVRHRQAAAADESGDFLEERDTRGAFPARIGIRIVLPDVAGPGRAEDRVRDGMTDHVGIGVPECPALGRAPSRPRERAGALRPAGASRNPRQRVRQPVRHGRARRRGRRRW